MIDEELESDLIFARALCRERLGLEGPIEPEIDEFCRSLLLAKREVERKRRRRQVWGLWLWGLLTLGLWWNVLIRMMA